MTLTIQWYDRKPDFTPDYEHEHHGNIHGANAAECMSEFRSWKWNHDLNKYTIPYIVNVAD